MMLSPGQGWGANPYANIQVPRLPVPPAGTGLATAPALAPAPREPIVRGQIADDPRPAATAAPSAVVLDLTPPSLPPPSAFGLAEPAEMDWTATRQRLRELGVVSFKVRETQGRWHFVCELRTATAGVLHHIESGPAATESEAVSLALAEAGRWRGGR